MKRITLYALGVLCAIVMCVSVCYGVEHAPRVSDREIIEALTELKAGQEALNQRFEQVDRRFEELRVDMNARFEQVDKRFEQVNARFGQMIGLFIGIIAAFAGIVGCTIAFAIWDRRTALKPVSEETGKVVRVLREYAQEEPRLAGILERMGML